MKLKLPLFLSRVSAGFPNPADDYLEKKLDLNEHLINHPAATFFVKVQGESMQEVGIYHGDLLIVDRSLTPKSGDIVVAVINGEFTVKKLYKKHNEVILMPANKDYRPMRIEAECQFEIWGKVIHSIKNF